MASFEPKWTWRGKSKSELRNKGGVEPRAVQAVRETGTLQNRARLKSAIFSKEFLKFAHFQAVDS